MLRILIHIVQSIKQVNLEVLATALPLPILFESRRKKLQRFLSLPEWNIETIWFPILRSLFSTYFEKNQVLYLAIDRTSWAKINLLMISLIWHKRALPIYFELLPKLGNSNLEEQKIAIGKVLPLFQEYQLIVLGDREFCSVTLANWLRTQSAYFCLRLKKDEYVQQAPLVWRQLQDYGLSPGISFFLQGVRVTKKKKIEGFNVALKWKRKCQGWTPEEGWFILTNLDSLPAAITAYSRRFGIEEMFRDFKSGGYNLEDTNVSGERLIALILVIAIAYSSATIFGTTIKRMGVQKYIGRLKERRHTSRRHSNFYIGLYGYTWVDFMRNCEEFVTELMRLNPNKQQYYRRGQRAMRLILSAS